MQATTVAYILTLPSCQLRTIQPLFYARMCCGAGKTKQSVYVFGGMDVHSSFMTSSKTWSPQVNQWRRLVNTRYAHAYFTPTLYRSNFYLISSGNLASDALVVCFNTVTEVFMELEVLLPIEFQETDFISFVNEGKICVLNNQGVMARWQVETEQKMRTSDTNRLCVSMQQPLVVDKMVFIASRGEILHFSFDSYSFL